MLAVLGHLAIATPAMAQRTQDEARLLFTFAVAYTGGSDLWAVEDQPIPVVGTAGVEYLDLARSLTGSGGLLVSGMYFPKPGLGLVGEAFFMGVGVEDKCQVTSVSPDPFTTEVCDGIDGSSKSSSAVLFTIGPMLRAAGNKSISPYIRAQVGFLFSNLSPVRVQTETSTGDIYIVFEDPSSTRITAGFVFGGGITTPLGKGWQFRGEVRDNLVQIATVAGPTGPGGYAPPIVNEWKNLWSIVLGADIVLEKKRGHRY
jgi:hypothetical protein